MTGLLVNIFNDYFLISIEMKHRDTILRDSMIAEVRESVKGKYRKGFFAYGLCLI